LLPGDLLDVEAEMTRLQAELGKAEKDLLRSGKKLQDGSFLSRAPEDVVEKERDRMAQNEEKIVLIKRNLASLSRQ